MIDRERAIRDYTEAIRQCAELLNNVDKKHGTYGVIEIRDIDITELGEIFNQYARSMEWREIRLQ